MSTIAISQEKLNRLLTDVETLIEDVSSILDQDELAKKRLSEVKSNPSISISEHELDAYLTKRGVKIERMGIKVTS